MPKVVVSEPQEIDIDVANDALLRRITQTPTPKFKFKPLFELHGEMLQRRCDIGMHEFRIYTEDQDSPDWCFDLEVFWACYFVGRFNPNALDGSAADRVKIAKVGMHLMTSDEFFAIRRPLIDAIINPVVSPNEMKPAA